MKSAIRELGKAEPRARLEIATEQGEEVDIERSWTDMTADERLQTRFHAYANPQLPFVSPETEAAYKLRVTRLTDAFLLRKTPDRVPVTTLNQFYPAHRAGFIPYDVMYDQEKAAEAWVANAHALELDAVVGPAVAAGGAGPILDALDYRLFSWPGHGVPQTASFQYVEKEWMRPEEYDDLIEDPTGYMLRTYIPRTNGALGGMAKLDPPFGMVQLCGAGFWVAGWGDPEVEEAFSKLIETGKQAAAWARAAIGADMRLTAEGFPVHPGLVTWAPFDFLGDTLRGTRGIVTDLYRHPEKVLEACERLLPPLLKYVTRKAAPFVPPTVFIPLHKGADGFMNEEQFRTFYWPTLRKMCLGLIEEGLVPYLFAEGAYNTRLEVIRDLPPRRTIWHFDQTDMGKAKEALDGIACIAGNVPLSLLQLGTPDEVKAYCRRLIGGVKGSGGFILDVGAGADEAKEENFRAMIRAAIEYGVY